MEIGDDRSDRIAGELNSCAVTHRQAENVREELIWWAFKAALKSLLTSRSKGLPRGFRAGYSSWFLAPVLANDTGLIRR